jgi:hypothetical protein
MPRAGREVTRYQDDHRSFERDQLTVVWDVTTDPLSTAVDNRRDEEDGAGDLD